MSNSNLDILTEKGQQTLEDELKAARIWKGHYPEYDYVMTPKDQPASIDAILVAKKVIKSVVETKCRYDMTLEDLFTYRKGEWLVTYDKILKAKDIAANFGVPLVGFLYIVESKVLLVQKLTTKQGHFIADMRLEETTTQKTVNGGIITRQNAFIKMHNAQIYA